VTAVQKDTSYIMVMSNIRSKEYESSILLYTKDGKRTKLELDIFTKDGVGSWHD